MKATITHKPAMASEEVYTDRDAFEQRIWALFDADKIDDIVMFWQELLFSSTFENDDLLVTIEEPIVTEC